MNNLLREYGQIRDQTIEILDKISFSDWRKPVCGEWNLKDVVAHLTGWAEYQIGVLAQFTKGETKIDKPKVENRNQESVAKRSSMSVEEVKQEFCEKTEAMIKAYGGLTDKEWQTPIWPGTKTTPEKFIKIEISHYGKTHLPQIQKLL